ncbi:hypothetical protein N7470_005392 [Penicillium chermesinum]|nr:hypothetical protein N7470_005392 [Penicillium chermesinum]
MGFSKPFTTLPINTTVSFLLGEAFQRVSSESLKQKLNVDIIKEMRAGDLLPNMHPAIMFRLCHRGACPRSSQYKYIQKVFPAFGMELSTQAFDK